MDQGFDMQQIDMAIAASLHEEELQSVRKPVNYQGTVVLTDIPPHQTTGSNTASTIVRSIVSKPPHIPPNSNYLNSPPMMNTEPRPPLPSTIWNSLQQNIFKTSICPVCNSAVLGSNYKALGRVYHLDCFRCDACQLPIQTGFVPKSDENTPDLMLLYHPQCADELFSTRCTLCGEVLRGSFLR